MTTKYHDQATEARAEYDQTIASIKETYKPKRVEGRDQRFADLENKTLAHKRRVATAKAWVDTSKKIRAIKADYENHRTTTRAATERKLNGLAGTPDLATIRHFHECRQMVAEAAKGKDATHALEELYESASLAGDVVLKRAIATRARGFEVPGLPHHSITVRHAQDHPEDSVHINTLAELDQAEHDMTTGFLESYTFNGPRNPFESGHARTECSAEYGLNTSDPRAVEQLAEMTA